MQEQCACGGTFNEKGVCQSCNAKRKRSKGYVVGHSILCCFFVFVFVCAMIGTSLARVMVFGSLPADTMAELDVATMPVGIFVDDAQANMTMAEYVHQEYVTDPAVSVADVEAVLKQIGIETYVDGKVTNLTDFYKGNTDTVQSMNATDVLQLLEDNENIIYNQLHIQIMPEDKLEIKERLNPVCDVYNRGVVELSDSELHRFLIRARISIWMILLEAAILVLLLIRWCVIFRRGRGRVLHGIRAFGITVFVTSLLFVLGGVGCIIAENALPDAYTMLSTLVHEVGMPMLLFSGIAALLGLFLMVLAQIMKMASKQPQPVGMPVEQSTEPQTVEEVPVPVMAGAADMVGDAPAFAEPTETAATEGTMPEPILEVPERIAEDPTPISSAAEEIEAAPTEPEEPVQMTESVPVAEPVAEPEPEAEVASEEVPAPAPESPQPAETVATCPSCSAVIPNPDTQKFCIQCGGKL